MSASVSSIRVVPAAGSQASGIGQYRYIAHIAEGGMADVFLAVTKGSGFEKLFVIKELRPSLAEDPTFVAMFMDEARLAARLNHPNVVQTYEVGADEGRRYFIAMEFLDGISYVRMSRLRERLPPPLAFHVRIIADVLHGLHYAHELKDFEGAPLHVVHRDVSPQNVMLTYAGGVKVLDFGIAKAALAVEQRPDDFKGKLEYMAPEQALVEPVDRRADVFSVGVMLWEAIARRRLYVKGDDKFAKLVAGEWRNLIDVKPDAPRRLVEITTRAMMRSPSDRYATSLEMAQDLEEWLDGTTQHVSARDVGTYVADKFATTRTKMNGAIELQLKLFRELADDTTDQFRVSRLAVNELTMETEALGPDPIPPPGASARPPPLQQQQGWSNPPSAAPPAPSMAPPILPRSAAPPARKQGSGSAIAIAILAVLLVIGGVAGTLAYLKQRNKMRAQAIVLTGTPITPAVAAPAPVDIDFTVKAQPPGARVFIDGQALDGNPVSGTRPRDTASHVVRVEAPGYEPKEERLAFDRSFFMTLELHPQEAAPAPAVAPSPSTSASGRHGRHSPKGPANVNGKAVGPNVPENPYE